MKVLFYLLIAASLISLSCSGNTTQNVSSTDIIDQLILDVDSTKQVVDSEYLSEKLNPIREYVAKIDSIPLGKWSLVRSVQFELNKSNVEATYHVWNSEIQKIVVVGKNGSHPNLATYYLKDRAIVYSFEKEWIASDDEDILETESYFENEVLIRSLDNQDCGAPYSLDYRESEQERIFEDLKVIHEAYNQNK